MLSTYDVIIAGGGWAGLTLARQLRLRSSGIRILVVEASDTFHSKVGEATVEIAGHYFLKHLRLANYMYSSHLPKNGLRFFFDTPEHDLSIHEMSEHGTSSIPPHPAFQIDRARFEKDLVKMNRDNDIEVLMGVRVTDFSINANAEPHNVTIEKDDLSRELTCNWFIDCSGRYRITRKFMKRTRSENVPQNFSSWGRFRNIRDIDSMGTQTWRQKAFGRFLSTNHFTGDGYWIWVIPLSGGHTSIGVVGERRKFKSVPKEKGEFLDFLNQQKGVSELLEGSELVDFEAWNQLAYRADEFIYPDRWATSGFSAMFLDPLFSGGGDMIALTNDFITRNVLDDFNSDDGGLPEEQRIKDIEITNQVVREYYQGLYAHIAHVYPVVDCAELLSPLLAYNTSAYFLEAAWDYMAGNFENQDYWLKKAHLRRGYMELEKRLQVHVIETAEVLKSEGRYFRRNDENFFESGGDYYTPFIFAMGTAGKEAWRVDLRLKLWTHTYLKLLLIRFNLPSLSGRMIVQNSTTYADILDKGNFSNDDVAWLLDRFSQTLTTEFNDKMGTELTLEVTVESLVDDRVCIDFSNESLEDKDIERLRKAASKMWRMKQDYIDMPNMVPSFITFARQQPTEMMDEVIDQRQQQ